MSDDTSSFSVLPWTTHAPLQDFVPECSRIFVKETYSLFICWRDTKALIFVLQSKIENLSSQIPIYNQAIASRVQILDVIEVNSSILIVSHTGLFQAIHSEGKRSWEVLDSLGDCKKFLLTDAFELSHLKKILSVTTIPDIGCASLSSYFAAITYSSDSCKIDAELYSVSHVPSFKCQLHAVICISNNVPEIRECFSTFLTRDQSAAIFCDLPDAEILLIGLDIGQLFCLPCYLSGKNYRIKPSPKLIYQSKWPIVGLACPADGFNIYLYLKSGTVVNISPLDKQSGKLDHSSLSYTSFSLPYPVKVFGAPKLDVFFVSDAINTSMVHIISPNQVDIQTIPVKGVTALTAVPNTSLVLASTFHNSYYLLDPFNSVKKSKGISQSWAGCNLDVSLQLVEDMKVQIQMLSQIKKELQDEYHIINALSTVARAHLLADQFSISAKVLRTFTEQDSKSKDTEIRFKCPVYQISIEIRNNSPEEFAPFLWVVSIDVQNPDGQTFSKNIPLTRTFGKNLPFTALLDIPYIYGKLCFPVYITTSLVGKIEDKNCENQWLKVRLGGTTLDVSHFFTVSMQAPQQCSRPALDVLEFSDQFQLQDSTPSEAKKDLKRKAMMTSYTIPVLEEYRQPQFIFEKLLSNCHHSQKLLIEKDFYNQSDKTVIWLYILHETVQLLFRKSCTSVTISCCNLELLHSVKLSLSTMLSGDGSRSVVHHTTLGASADTAHCKAKNLNAVLEILSLEEAKDIKQLLEIYQDLRNNVSSQI